MVPSTSRAGQQVGCEFDFDPKRSSREFPPLAKIRPGRRSPLLVVSTLRVSSRHCKPPRDNSCCGRNRDGGARRRPLMMRIISTFVDDGTSARTIPSSMISNAVVTAAAVVAIMCGSTDSTRADIPQIDIEGTCRAAAHAMVSLMGGSTTEQDRKACLDSEQKAREQIIKDQATYSSADKRRCMRTRDYLPSYVEWLTCLEMERDVRKMRAGRATCNGHCDASKGTAGTPSSRDRAGGGNPAPSTPSRTARGSGGSY